MVSVVIPAYNCGSFIKDTLDSVSSQTFKDVEVIAVDDGSDDDTAGIIEGYEGDLSIKLLSNRYDRGPAGARNTGIEEAAGRFVAFLDSDDMWLPEKLEKQLSLMKERDCAFSFTGYEFADSACRGTGRVVRVPEAIDYRHALSNTTIFTSTVIFDTEKLSKEDILFPYVESEDTANWWKVLKKVPCAYGLDEALTLYRRSGSTLSSNKLRALKRTWKLYRDVEQLPFMKSLACFTGYGIRAARRRLGL